VVVRQHAPRIQEFRAARNLDPARRAPGNARDPLPQCDSARVGWSAVGAGSKRAAERRQCVLVALRVAEVSELRVVPVCRDQVPGELDRH